MLLAWHVLFVVFETVYPGLQLKVVIDMNVVPLENNIEPCSGGVSFPQSIKKVIEKNNTFHFMRILFKVYSHLKCLKYKTRTLLDRFHSFDLLC